MKLQELREARAAKAAEAKAILDKSTYTKEDDSQVEAIYAAIDLIETQIKRIERAVELEAQLDTPEARARQRSENGDRRSVDELTGAEQQATALFTAWARSGINGMSAEQREIYNKIARPRDEQSASNPTQGGYLAPTDFVNSLLEALKAYGGARDVAQVIRTDHGRDLEHPTIDETAEEGEIVGENQQAGSGDLEFGTVKIGAYKYSSKRFAVPFELLMDSYVDVPSLIRKSGVQRIGRRQNKDFTIGDGIDKPKGIVTGAAVGYQAPSGNTTTISYDFFVELMHSVDPAYRTALARWMFNDTVLKATKKLKDSTGRPLWRPGMGGSDPDNILNHPYVINQSMADPAASAKSIAFGDFSKYVVRDVMTASLWRFEDSYYVERGQVGFLIWARSDGAKIDAGDGAYKVFQQSAS